MDRYNIAKNKQFQGNGHDYLFLSDSSAIFEIFDDGKEMLRQASSVGTFSYDDIASGYAGLHGEAASLFEELVSQRVFIPELEEKSGGLRNISKDRFQLSTLVLQVTDACNLGCDYCYHRPEGNKKDPDEKMSSDVGRRAVDFLFEHSHGRKELTLVFFGGEPLLNFDVIRDITAYAEAAARLRDKKVRYALTTNATVMTDAMVRFFKENEFSITVSMDGYREAHDRHRRFKDGAPSYEVISPKIEKLVHGMAPIPVAARVTTTRGQGDIPGILSHLLSMGFSEAGFAPVTTGDFRFMLDEKDMDLLLDEFEGISERFLAMAKKGDLLGFTNLIDLLVVLHEGDIKQYPCGAGQDLFCSDATGRLYLCQRFAGEPEGRVGDIDGGVDGKKIEKFMAAVTMDREILCGTCWAKNICAGGCYQEAMVRQGNPTAPNRHYCRWIKNWTEIGLKVYGRLVSGQPDYLDRLAGVRGRSNK
jgi:uncharacterized protein